MTHATELGKMDQQLLEIYAQSEVITFDNVTLQEILREPQKKIECTLADAVNAHTQKTCEQVKRVALACVIHLECLACHRRKPH